MKKLTTAIFLIISTSIWAQTSTQLVKDITPNGDSYLVYFAELNNVIFFRALNNGTDQLWRSDGTEGGTYVVSNTAHGIQQIHTTFNNEVYFNAGDGSFGKDLWKSDGTNSGTVLVANIQTFGGNYVEYNGSLYFSAMNDASGSELWVTDGSIQGTQLLKEINNGTASSSPSHLVVFDNELYFIAEDGSSREIWKTDGTTNGTVKVSDLNSTISSPFPSGLTVYNNKLIFSLLNGDNFEIWSSDGTTNGTTLSTTIPLVSGTSNYSNDFHLVNNKLFFRLETEVNGIEPWITDGTNSGTFILKDIASGTAYSNPSFLNTMNNQLFFYANDQINGEELWVTDGTVSGTELVKDINTTSGSYPRNAFVVDNLLYFSAEDQEHGQELWSTDGTSSNTQLILDMKSGTESSNISIMGITTNGNIFVNGDDGTVGSELYLLSNNTTGFLSATLNRQIESYPNPCTESFTISLENDKLISAKATSASGISYTLEITDDTVLVDRLVEGVYTILFTSKSGKQFTSRISKH